MLFYDLTHMTPRAYVETECTKAPMEACEDGFRFEDVTLISF